MFTRLHSRLSRYLGASALAFGLAGSAWAQVPTSVDIDLAPGASANQLNVLMRANGSSFSEVFSGLTFTIRYAETSTATLSAGSSAWCPGPSFPIAPTTLVTPGNGFKYRTYNSIATLSMENVDDGGCGAVLPVGEWVVVHTITVSNNPNCTEFQVVNDDWTQQFNRNFFVSLNGVQGLAGSIEPTPVQRGNCTADCAGVIGGTATIDGCGVCSGGTTGITPQQPASASFSYAGTPYCSNAGTVNPAFSGTTGGSFSSTAGLIINSGTGAVNTGSSTAGSYTVTYTVAAYGTCPQFQTTAPITISALPAAGTLSGNQSICVGGATTFSSNVSGGTWSSGNEAVASVNPSTGAITGVSAGSATMTYTVTAAGCPDATATRSVTVTAAPVAGTISGTPQGICVGGTTTYAISGNSATGTWGTDNPAVATVVNGVVTGQGAGTTNITYTVAGTGGCAPATTTRSVTVTAAPVAGTISGTPQGICVGGTTTYTISGNSATGTWGTDNPAVATVVNGVVTGQGAGTTNITYTVAGTGGCAAATTTRSVTVTAAPVAGTISGTPQGICVGGTTTYTISGNSAAGTWGTDNPAVATVVNGVVTGQGAGTTNITYTVAGTGGCAPATTTRSVTVTATTNNTTTETACDSYTWSVNGVTYTQSGTYTNTVGCATETLVLTITPSTSNTTTLTECDSYTWSVNGQTYTQSGTYTSVSGCNTEVLVLTIVTSTNNTTTVSACDSYTWNVNGQTYTQSGTYTSVSGCGTQTLVLTITPSTSNTTTVSECDSYTWSVNGQTYTQSGTYTSVNGCATEVLVLTILQSGTNTTTESACDSYTWSVNGQTYTQSGTYTSVTGCSTEILVLTITPSSTQSESVTVCGTVYTWSVNGQAYTQSGTYTSVNGCVTSTLNLTLNVPGTPCDDGDENTINDALNINCVCEGTPVGPGCDFNELEIEIVTDGVSTTLWEIRAQGTNALAISGGQLYPQGTFTETICLPDGCYYLVVTDDAGDGISGGGYVLRRPNDRRIIDNRGNFSAGYTSQIANGEGFCLPMGTDRLIATSCDREWWTGGPEYVVANGNPAVTAIWNSFPAGSTERATSGYQMWWFDPNGGYSFRRFQSHSTSNGLPASATRACHFLVNGWVGNQLQAGVLYNVRVRSRVLGAYTEFGPTCRFRIDATLAQCPPTQLVNSQGFAEFSCGVVRQFPSSNKIWAWSRPGANKYQFEFSIPAEGILFTRNSNTNWIALSWTSGTPLLDGRTYNVRVRISKTNGATWCAWGETCTVAINNGSSGMAAETSSPASGAEAMVSDRLIVWPNPNRGEQLNLRIEGLTSAAGTMTVDLYDLVGNRVMALTKAVQDGHVNGAIELPADMATGMYMLQVTGAGRTWTERVVIQR